MSHQDIYEQLHFSSEQIKAVQHNISKRFTTAEIIEVINAKKNRESAASPPSLSSRRGSFGGHRFLPLKRQVA